MATIQLSKGHVAIVDDDDVGELLRYPWHATENGHTTYARRYDLRTGRMVYMHRQLVEPRPGFEVDHANGNGLDNRRANLREASPSENKANRPHPRRHRSSPYRGVSLHRASGRWRAELRGKSLGYFPDPLAASHAYDAAAREAFGAFAQTNHLEEIE